MSKLFFFLFLFLSTLVVKAQTNPSTQTQLFGIIDTADLKMTACDFEKDANAMVLFDKGTVYFHGIEAALERHVRIKIFNDRGKGEADIKLRYLGGIHLEYISGIQAETINLNNGAIEFTKVDKKLIFSQRIDKFLNEMVFSFPDAKAGSVIEFKYTLTSYNIGALPNWYFQTNIPTRYSEINTDIPNFLHYKNLVMVNQPFVKNTEDVKALANIPSLNDEPYMSSFKDNAQRILYQLISITGGKYPYLFSDTWKKVGQNLSLHDDFGRQLGRNLSGENVIINKAKSFNTDAGKIAYIFDEVKNSMKWNEEDEPFTDDGTAEAWNKKTGNSTEINLILYHLLMKSGVKVYPMLVSTRDNGKINPAYPNGYQFNRTVAYVPVDSTFNYILDATSKYNVYNETPADLLNGFGLYINRDDDKYDLVFLQNTSPVREVTSINAEISQSGKMTGTVNVNSFSYYRADHIEKYKTDGEEKYIKALRNGDNNLKISSLKFEDMEIDTLPLTQSFEFSLDLTSSDENYIYFKPNLFASEFATQFLSDHRFTDIDFGYITIDALNGTYKIPVGYKIDAMPKSLNMAMPDNSIFFRRMVAQEDGVIAIRYLLHFNKSQFFKEDYPEFHEFFKKMYELLNEQIVLKKS